MGAELLRLRSSDLSWRELDEEIVVLDLEGAEYLSVRGAGRTLWPLLANGATKPQLIAAITAEYEVDDETAARDVDAFVAELRQKGFIDGS
jgi:hypothetical protein